jgi:hypothetical protein
MLWCTKSVYVLHAARTSETRTFSWDRAYDNLIASRTPQETCIVIYLPYRGIRCGRTRCAARRRRRRQRGFLALFLSTEFFLFAVKTRKPALPIAVVLRSRIPRHTFLSLTFIAVVPRWTRGLGARMGLRSRAGAPWLMSVRPSA